MDQTTSPATLYAGTAASGSTPASGVYKTTDGGAHWTSANVGLPASDVRSLVIDPTNPQTLYAGLNGGGVYKTTTLGTGGLPGNRILSEFRP